MKKFFCLCSIALSVSAVAQEKAAGVSKPVSLSIGFNQMKVASGVSDPIKIAIGSGAGTRADVASVAKEEATAAIAKTAPVAAPANRPNYYALLIGVERYQYANANLGNLNQPVKDANALMTVLAGDYSFKQENVLFLKNPTRDQIITAFEDLARKVTVKDNLLIFYAGHGIWDERLKVGYWLPSDAKTDNKSAWIANSTIRDYISGIQSKHTLLITDACFSGSIFKTREVISEVNEYAVAKIYQLPSRKAMTSGTLTTVPDTSKFMEYLLKRLRDNTNAFLTARQLFFSVETAVMNNTNTVPQFGVIQETGDEGGDFIFMRK